MSFRWGLGPVFAYECLTTSRRWQVYAGRSLLVTSILVGLTLVGFNRLGGQSLTSFRDLAAVGTAFFGAILAVELVLALVVVPAATAGAICQDKMRGGLALMMVTDLSDAEIVLGKLASRLVTVLGVVACGLPVLAIATSLGGVDPLEILGGSMVIVGVSVLGVAVALTFSVWATRPHEALMATYATWAIWLLALLAWSETSRGTTPAGLYGTNPFWQLFGDRVSSAATILVHRAAFLAGTLVISAALATISTWRIRGVALRQASRSERRVVPRRGVGGTWRRWPGMPDTSLDANPVLWREWHRRQPSGWGRAIWRLYAAVSALFMVLAVFANPWIAPGVGGFMVSIGLLMLSVTSATALAEERAYGSLDILLATPLATREIVLGKWWGASRIVPRLAILPGMLAFGSAMMRGRGMGAFAFAALIAALVLAYGAVITGLGLALATWQPRLGRAVGLSVTAYLSATVIYPSIALMTVHTGPEDVVFLWVSPFFGMFIPLGWNSWGFASPFGERWFAMSIWVALTSAVAYVLLRATLHSFDHLLGRVSDRVERSSTRREHEHIPLEPLGTASSRD
jgi:ABC-type transport system involved in multi-copper enzyme maturation permease subunit